MVKIIGGQWKRKNISFFEHDGLRPTLGRVRETLFNWLGQDLSGKDCLDLFSGSGALGFESLSRGASGCIFVGKNRHAYENLKNNKANLNADRAEIIHSDASNFLRNNLQSFDVIFFDPPFHEITYFSLLANLKKFLKNDGCIYVESSAKYVDSDYKILKEARVGQVYFYLLTV